MENNHLPSNPSIALIIVIISLTTLFSSAYGADDRKRPFPTSNRFTFTSSTNLNPVNCNVLASPLVGFDISKGQNPDDVSDFLNDLPTYGVSAGTVDLSTGAIPTCVDILVIHGLANNVSLTAAYDDADAAMIKSWAVGGHGVMLSGDWGGFKGETQALFKAYGYSQLGGWVTDSNDYDPEGPSTDPTVWVIYQTDNFDTHPILAGVSKLQLQASSWLDQANGAIVTTDVGANPELVPVMAAFTDVAGCVAMTTDSNWYATDGGSGGYHKKDNAQVARQMILWLSACEAVLTAVPGGPYLVDEGSIVRLDGSESFNPEGGILTYTWDFDGDGQFDDATGATPIFSAALLDDGSYLVSLHVSNGTDTSTNFTDVLVQNVAPDVTAVAATTVITVGHALAFSGTFSDPGTLDTHIISWDFDDNSTAVDATLTPTHAFNAAGHYIVTLTVTDDDGGIGQASVTVQVVGVGETAVYLPIITNNYCHPGNRYSDIALTLDTSKSMLEPAEPGGPTKLEAAQIATTEFIKLLTFPGDLAAIVSFDNDAVLEHALSNNRTRLIATVYALNPEFKTRIDLALAVARDELTSSRHNASNSQSLILLTDGRPWGVTETAVLNEAAITKAAGIEIYTIGLGENAHTTLLEAIASSNDHYYFAPSTAELDQIYQRIATALACSG